MYARLLHATLIAALASPASATDPSQRWVDPGQPRVCREGEEWNGVTCKGRDKVLRAPLTNPDYAYRRDPREYVEPPPRYRQRVDPEPGYRYYYGPPPVQQYRGGYYIMPGGRCPDGSYGVVIDERYPNDPIRGC
jgi:hypothetical protein